MGDSPLLFSSFSQRISRFLVLFFRDFAIGEAAADDRFGIIVPLSAAATSPKAHHAKAEEYAKENEKENQHPKREKPESVMTCPHVKVLLCLFDWIACKA